MRHPDTLLIQPIDGSRKLIHKFWHPRKRNAASKVYRLLAFLFFALNPTAKPEQISSRSLIAALFAHVWIRLKTDGSRIITDIS